MIQNSSSHHPIIFIPFLHSRQLLPISEDQKVVHGARGIQHRFGENMGYSTKKTCKKSIKITSLSVKWLENPLRCSQFSQNRNRSGMSQATFNDNGGSLHLKCLEKSPQFDDLTDHVKEMAQLAMFDFPLFIGLNIMKSHEPSRNPVKYHETPLKVPLHAMKSH